MTHEFKVLFFNLFFLNNVIQFMYIMMELLTFNCMPHNIIFGVTVLQQPGQSRFFLFIEESLNLKTNN